MESPLDLAFLKDRYDYELDRKDKLTASLTLPVGILTGLGGLLAVMFRSFTYSSPWLTIPFVAFLAVAVLSFVVCLVFIGRAWHFSEYEYMAFIGTLDRTLQEYEAYYEGDPKTAGEEFTGNLRRSIIQAADANTELNDRRSKFLYRARIALFVLLVAWSFGGVVYVIDQVRDGMTNPRQTQQPVPPAASQGQTGTGRPTNPPAFPPNRVIREGHEPTERPVANTTRRENG